MSLNTAVALLIALEGSDLEVLIAPLDVVLGPNVVEPDIVAAPCADFTDRDLSVDAPSPLTLTPAVLTSG